MWAAIHGLRTRELSPRIFGSRKTSEPKSCGPPGEVLLMAWRTWCVKTTSRRLSSAARHGRVGRDICIFQLFKDFYENRRLWMYILSRRRCGDGGTSAYSGRG